MAQMKALIQQNPAQVQECSRLKTVKMLDATARGMAMSAEENAEPNGKVKCWRLMSTENAANVSRQH